MTGLQLARHWKVLILGPDAELAGSARAILQREVPSIQLFDVRTYPEATSLPGLIQHQSLSLCLLDAVSHPETAFQILREFQRIAPRLPVLTMLTGNDPEVILGCLRQGAADFVTHPFHVEQFDQVFLRAARAFPELMPAQNSGRVLAAMPAKGGCGASTVALNLAFQKKKLGSKRLLLMDLDPLTGVLSFLLKAKASYSFLDALNRAGAMDQDIWRSLVVPVGGANSGLEALVGPDTISEELYALADPAPVLEVARAYYDHVIVDCASVYGPWNLRIAQLADDVLLISNPDPGTLKSTQRALRYLTERQVPERKIHLVMNRVQKESALGMDIVQTALRREVLAAIPADPEAIHEAMLEGRPVAAGSSMAKGMAALASALAPETSDPGPGKAASAPKQAKPSRSGALAGLLGLFGKR